MKKEKMKFKEGQTYTCTKSSLTWFTKGKEYPVIVNDYGKLAIQDNDGTTWLEDELYDGFTCFKLKGENKMELKIGDKVKGITVKNANVEGKIIEIDESDPNLTYAIMCNDRKRWLKTESVELIAESEPVKQVYTKSEINQQIFIAYQQFDNDTQRLAYLQGYFAK